MPNRSGNTKRRRRNEKLRKAEVLPTSDATCTELPSSSGVEASTTSGDRGFAESKEDSTEVSMDDGETTGTRTTVMKNIVTNDEKSTQPDEEKKKKKKRKKKKKTSQDNENDNEVDGNDMSRGEEGTVGEHSEIEGGTKNGDSDDEHIDVLSSGVDTEETNDEVPSVGEEIAAHERPEVVQERNFSRLTRLLLGVGANCLRDYFLSIHPKWNNQPTDASALKKGVFHLQNHEQAKFYTGNIYEWDVSLLIRVLRFTDLSSVELKHNPDKDDALRNIQEMRNNVIAHAKDKKVSDSNFKVYWKNLKRNLVTIGGSEEVIDATLTDYTELALEQCQQLFLEQVSLQKFSKPVSEKNKSAKSTSEENNEIHEFRADPQCWDDWLKFSTHMNSFNSSQTQFILLADVMTQTDVDNFKVLAAVPWTMVIDFNPSSEDDGLYKVMSSQTSFQRILSPFTPGDIAKAGYIGLPKQVDPKRTQWLFANGRKEDAESSQPKSFPDWEQRSVMSITMFFTCCACSNAFDKLKPIRCLLLPVSEAALPFIEVALRRLIESFSLYDLSIASIDNSCNSVSLLKPIHAFNLSSAVLKNGVGDLLNVTKDFQKYEMPCFQAGIRFPFLHKDYVYMSEYLELFYIGCQNEFINTDDEEEVQKKSEEHRKWFFSGNMISFLSLSFNHDAKREIEKEIEIHIQRMLNQTLKQSTIVQIAHPPGTGGSTIARRVLWNIHKSFPCASVRLLNQAEFDEDSNFLNELSSRISILEDQCGIPPVILIDGHRQWRIHALSNRIVRNLNSSGKKAVILECHRGSKPYPNADVHQVFSVDACLEGSSADLQEFKEKFKEFSSPASRVFHFPLLSMVTEFHEKLKEIVIDTLNELDDLENDIAAFVAFLQLYAEQPTPAILLYEVFQSRLSIKKGIRITYESIKECFSGSLLNLMVHQKRQKVKYDCHTHYTLQHYVVATFLFEKYLKKKKKTLYKYVCDFLQYNVSNIEQYVALYCDLFLFNRGGNRKLRFSVLMEELRNVNEKQAGTVLCKAAELIPDPRAYGHAARFYAKMTSPKFEDAKKLVALGIKLSESRGRRKSIQDSKGVVLSLELKHMVRKKKIKDIETLEEMAQKALDAFRAARDFPPTFASPLIGEVEVWISCIEWITQANSGNADEAVKFIVSKAPPFFRTCIGDSFYLLELVDKMVQSVASIADPDEIRDRAQYFRIQLMSAVKPGILKNGRWRNLFDSFFNIAPGLKLPKISFKESKRIRTRMLLSLYWREQQSLDPKDMNDLIKLLDDMVIIEKDYSFAPHFLQLCLLGLGPRTYSLESGWKVCRDWLEEPECLDPMRYYYSMVIAFVQILNGLGLSGYFAEYKNLVQKLKDASRGQCRKYQSLHYLKKNGTGISQLISHQALLRDESYYNMHNPEIVKSFWKVESRRKLKECTGRVRVKVKGAKKVTTIELLEGDVEVHVGKYAGIGIPGKDFDKDAKVYFAVSFNLSGPVANGITFCPVPEQKNDGVSFA